ncbi:ATP-binding protein [Streptomyces sp. NPDC058613]|uniref:ATP-binding protein n=1 Tax=unclassified Streptomyces TaxID=2593676 RepID=UPI003658A1DB
MWTHRSISVSAAFEGTEKVAAARALARSFLADVQDKHGLAVSVRALETVELVVSELVTNARKYAPGPYLLGLGIQDGCVEVSVWDSSPTPPAVLTPDPYRVGQHGLEIVIAAARTFRVRPEGAGKRVTAAIALADDPAGDPDVDPDVDPAHDCAGDPADGPPGGTPGGPAAG